MNFLCICIVLSIPNTVNHRLHVWVGGGVRSGQPGYFCPCLGSSNCPHTGSGGAAEAGQVTGAGARLTHSTTHRSQGNVHWRFSYSNPCDPLCPICALVVITVPCTEGAMAFSEKLCLNRATLRAETPLQMFVQWQAGTWETWQAIVLRSNKYNTIQYSSEYMLQNKSVYKSLQISQSNESIQQYKIRNVLTITIHK